MNPHTMLPPFRLAQLASSFLQASKPGSRIITISVHDSHAPSYYEMTPCQAIDFVQNVVESAKPVGAYRRVSELPSQAIVGFLRNAAQMALRLPTECLSYADSESNMICRSDQPLWRYSVRSPKRFYLPNPA
ncbi:hypothetical protein Tcan_17295 [Toxocara canis]|uniref:Uncharacterized protein n=1 Tax=Toxocara canis TaxID=6265 RepID=A0A0B2VBJ6_TOXCA|nr:hypothetical protein Tcan_17295 [Toxocara canis]